MFIFDLDGTLIDSSERMYRLFQRLIPESIFSKEEYWKLKRNCINHKMIIDEYFPSYNFDEFNRKWLNMIELEEYLVMDNNYSDTIDVLNYLNKIDKIILLTARQSINELLWELERLNIRKYFDEVYITESKKTKLDILLQMSINNCKDVFFVSDMGEDIIIGKSLDFKTIAITHGFMSADKLNEYKPDLIIDDLSELKKLLSYR